MLSVQKLYSVGTVLARSNSHPDFHSPLHVISKALLKNSNSHLLTYASCYDAYWNHIKPERITTVPQFEKQLQNEAIDRVSYLELEIMLMLLGGHLIDIRMLLFFL